ncbi:MAG: GNAT family N-acetyltransferase [Alphaproteobacteria bacterium]
MAVEIRLTQPADQDRCLELLRGLGGPDGRPTPPGAAETFQHLLDRSRGEVWAAVVDGEVLGMAAQSFNLAMRYGGEYAQLEELIVDPKARGLKLGGFLLEAAIESARGRGCREFGLYLVEWTTHNQPFYEKYGLKVVGAEMRMGL